MLDEINQKVRGILRLWHSFMPDSTSPGSHKSFVEYFKNFPCEMSWITALLTGFEIHE